MPRDHRIGFDQNECFGPVLPYPPKDHPEQPIGSMQLGARLLALVNGELLPKYDGFQAQSVAGDYKCQTYARTADRSVNINLMLLGDRS